MGAFIEPGDLAPFSTITPEKAAAMIADAESQAVLTAPCLPGLLVAAEGESEADAAVRVAKLAAVKAVLRAAVLRWDEAGSGAIYTEVTGPFSQTQQVQGRRSMFWPSEVASLQGICKGVGQGKAFAVDTAMGVGFGGHSSWCNLMFRADGMCSCGANLTAGVYPLYG